jgi:hypothetical protein
MQVVWNLKPFLQAHNITLHRLAREANMPSANLYALMAGDGAINVNRDKLARLIGALCRLTGTAVQISDVLVLQVSPAPADPVAMPDLTNDLTNDLTDDLTDVPGLIVAAGRFIPAKPIFINKSPLTAAQMIAEERR